MSIQEALLNDMKEALKSGDKLRLGVIRSLRARIKNAEIEKRGELSPDEVVGVLTRAVKMRKDAIELYSQGQREDLVSKEKAELDIITEYLPKQLSESEIEEIIDETIATVGATGVEGLGRVMRAVMPKLKGRADGRVVNELVRERLARL